MEILKHQICFFIPERLVDSLPWSLRAGLSLRETWDLPLCVEFASLQIYFMLGHGSKGLRTVLWSLISRNLHIIEAREAISWLHKVPISLMLCLLQSYSEIFLWCLIWKRFDLIAFNVVLMVLLTLSQWLSNCIRVRNLTWLSVLLGTSSGRQRTDLRQSVETLWWNLCRSSPPH